MEEMNLPPIPNGQPMTDDRQRTDLTQFAEKIQLLRDRISQVIVGQRLTVDLILTAILADGHVLIEGVPGVAKTLLARTIAKLIDTKFSRVQFTPDLMPSDVLGTSVFNMKTSEFEFHQDPCLLTSCWWMKSTVRPPRHRLPCSR